MKPKILLCAFFILFVTGAFAQNGYSVKGSIADSVEKVKLGTSAVAILQEKDSILVTFGYAKSDGTFMLDGLRKGKYILLVTYPDYADYAEQFSLDSAHTFFDFRVISMSLKTRLLKEVLIKGTASQMKIKGDTTEFNAKAFVIQPNANVEDLLKQLPGITIDKDGKITAEGQPVNKVLVDGEEFFGDDPTLVTRNIRADMVDKIQLYDKKSDQAAFTGVDDGKTQKTINVKLRADKNQGVFGKVQAGESPNDIYQGELLFNAFQNKEKFSVYGVLGNNGKVGLGWEDNQKYGTGDQLDVSDNGISVNTQSTDDLDVFGGIYSGQGFPLAQSGGVHYDGKWDDDKQSVNANYKIGSLTINGLNDVLSQNNTPGYILNNGSDQNYHNSMFRQKLSVVYQTKLDTSSNLKISIDGTLKHIITDENYASTDTLNSALVNRETRDLNNTVDQRAFNGSAFYTKKFRKPGRTLSFLVTEAYSQSQANGFLKSDIHYYSGQTVTDSTLNESKINNLQSNIFNTNLTYSEPFTKTLALVVNYGIGINFAGADRNTFNASSPGVYNVPDDALSSNYTFNQFLNHAGAILNYKKGKLSFNFGTRVTDDQFHQVDENTMNASDRTFIDWAPQARFEYRFSQQKMFAINYNGTTTQPTLEQLQPVASNTDPLNIIEGNPALTPSFTNTININYRSYKVLTSQFFGFYGGYSIVSNPIVNHINYNTLGQSVSQYFNLPGKTTTNFYGGMDFGRKFQSLGGLNTGVGFNVNGNTSYNYTNDSLSMSKNYVFNPMLRVSMYKENKIELGLSGGPTYTISETSLQAINNNGWGAQGDIDGTIYLPAKFEVGTYSSYQYNAATASFHQDYSKFLLNVFITKKFLKNKNLSIELWGNDLLNQNSGFTRNAQGNVITQTTYNTLKRYYMLTINTILPKWAEEYQKNSAMKKKIILFALFLGLVASLRAQHAHFTTSGTIEFEKRTNAYALIQKAINKDNEAWLQPAFDFYKKNSPQFRVLTAKLAFGDDKTLYTPNEADMPQNALMGDSPMLNQFNTIFTDLTAKNAIDQKKVFEQTYLVKDSVRKIKWKITDETRDIAGYTCRRANGIYLDSVYVVAFYTTRIPVPGGPESFSGLPGMILGVALPHENMTWFATKVTEGYASQNNIVPPKKGKATNEKDLWKILQDASESWGRIGKLYLKGFML